MVEDVEVRELVIILEAFIVPVPRTLAFNTKYKEYTNLKTMKMVVITVNSAAVLIPYRHLLASVSFYFLSLFY
jgi:hypothetical protein